MIEGVAPGAAAAFVDLHTHSTASDGTLPPEQVIAAAAKCGLSALALTDHDTLDGLPAARAAGDAAGIRVIAGVELSALHEGRELHLLGLHLHRIEPLEAQLAEFRATRRTRGEQIVERLNTLGIPLQMSAVLAQSAGASLGRPHVARAMVEGGWAHDFKDAFDRFLGSGRPAFVPKHRLLMADAIRLVHDAGGLAIWAHPAQEGSREKVASLIPLGLDGVEVRHPSHSAEDTVRLQALADHYRLVSSGGSDWHGASEGPRTLGNMKVPRAVLDRQDELVASRRAAAISN